MKKSSNLKSSLTIAASGLAAATAQAAVVTTSPNVTFTLGEPSYQFDITNDTVPDYQFAFADSDARKPQITSSDFDTVGAVQNLILMPDSDEDVRVLPVIAAGQTVEAGSMDSLNEAFFYLNYNQNYFGDWGGAGGGPAATTGGGATPTAPATGPVEGYVTLMLPALGGGFNYGYAHVSVDVTEAYADSATASITLLDTAFETETDTALVGAITVNPIPEPSLTALMAGAAGLLGLRRRRAQS